MNVFAESVLASFDSETPIVWDTAGIREAVARFSVAEAQVLTTFTKTDDQSWRVGFDVKPPNSLPATLSLRVLSGVFHAVKEFVEVRQPERLVFDGKNEGLGGLYETYLSKQGTLLHGMGYVMKTPVDSSPTAEFTIVKTKPSEWRD